MSERDPADKPLTGHEDKAKGRSIGERISDFIDGVVEALDAALSPTPRPVPIPVRQRPYPYRR